MSVNDADRERLEKLARPAQSRPRDSHVWVKDPLGYYVEPRWVDERLFKVERFDGVVWDPACGSGRIPDAARAAGYSVVATDAVNRGYEHFNKVLDFFGCDELLGNVVVSNPPYDYVREFVEHALILGADAVAMICQARWLNAARWLQTTPLARVYLLTPRPSMPPGRRVEAGLKPQGQKDDFIWLIFRRDHFGPPELRWLHRDGVQS
jgi:hypothetical protein